MNILTWSLSVALVIALMSQAISFHKSTVCRQEAWLKSIELKTNALLSKPASREHKLIPKCKIHVIRNYSNITWNYPPSLKNIVFNLDLQGNL